MADDFHCPECGTLCERDEVDIGVGVQTGPWHCPECGWSMDIDEHHNEDEDSFEDEIEDRSEEDK